MPFTAAKSTFAFSAQVKILRLLSLLVKPFFMTGYSLNYCPEFGDLLYFCIINLYCAEGLHFFSQFQKPLIARDGYVAVFYRNPHRATFIL